MIILQERCKHFKDENVRKVFELVAADEMLKTNEKVPDFERITTTINDAIDKCFMKNNPTQSERTKRASSSDYYLIARKMFSG